MGAQSEHAHVSRTPTARFGADLHAQSGAYRQKTSASELRRKFVGSAPLLVGCARARSRAYLSFPRVCLFSRTAPEHQRQHHDPGADRPGPVPGDHAPAQGSLRQGQGQGQHRRHLGGRGGRGRAQPAGLPRESQSVIGQGLPGVFFLKKKNLGSQDYQCLQTCWPST